MDSSGSTPIIAGEHVDLTPIIDTLPADKDGLLSFCWGRITDGQLEHISNAPYSENSLALERLNAFRDSAPHWSTADWGYAPSEAIELVRWTQLNEGDGTTPIDHNLRGWHGMRLTCCVTIAYMHVLDLANDLGPGHTALILAHSAMALGVDASKAAFTFSVWVLQQNYRDYANLSQLQWALAVFCLGVSTRMLSVENMRLLLDWLEYWEANRAENAGADGPWLFRLSDWQPSEACLRHMVTTLADNTDGLAEPVQMQLSRLRTRLR